MQEKYRMQLMEKSSSEERLYVHLKIKLSKKKMKKMSARKTPIIEIFRNKKYQVFFDAV